MTGSIMMVAAGLGISIVPRSAGELQIEGIGYVPLDDDELRAPISLAYKRERCSRPVQNLVATARRIVQTAASAKDRTPSGAVE